MIKELQRIEKLVSKKITNITNDQECEEYAGFNFKIEQLNIKFRKAKVTPKKIGQFVTLWKRNSNGQTEPFNVNDDVDFYIIATEQENKSGLFLFSKYILGEKRILTTPTTVGKRGFRVYSDWNTPENKQAEKTKSWQTTYFIDLRDNEIKNKEKFNSIISQHE